MADMTVIGGVAFQPELQAQGTKDKDGNNVVRLADGTTLVYKDTKESGYVYNETNEPKSKLVFSGLKDVKVKSGRNLRSVKSDNCVFDIKDGKKNSIEFDSVSEQVNNSVNYDDNDDVGIIQRFKNLF